MRTISILAAAAMAMTAGKAWAICQPDDTQCIYNQNPGECDDAPNPDPYPDPVDDTESAAHRRGYVGWSPTERAQCGGGIGAAICRYKIRLSGGAAGSFECELVCVIDSIGREECHIAENSCHLI